MECGMLTPKHRALFAAAYSAQLLRKSEEPERSPNEECGPAAKPKEDKEKGELRKGEMPAA
jgi:hypothetical protein